MSRTNFDFSFAPMGWYNHRHCLKQAWCNERITRLMPGRVPLAIRANNGSDAATLSRRWIFPFKQQAGIICTAAARSSSI